jgi:hypothetical protein
MQREWLRLVVAITMVAGACNKSTTTPAQGSASGARPEGSASSPRKYHIAPIEHPHQPTPAELGPPVDVTTAYEALCAALPDDLTAPTTEQLNQYVTGAMFQYPNAEVVKFWQSLGTVSPAERIPKIRSQLAAAKISSCPLADVLAARGGK